MEVQQGTDQVTILTKLSNFINSIITSEPALGKGEQGPRPGPRACGGPAEHQRGAPHHAKTRGAGPQCGQPRTAAVLACDSHILGPPKFECGLLILRKIIKTVPTRCHILRLKSTKFDFGWGSAPDPAGGAYSAPPDPLAALMGPYF